MVFDRPAGSERDLVVLAELFDATIVQRHPAGSVRVVGSFGVLRWHDFRWHHEPPARSWMDAAVTDEAHGDPVVIEDLLKFAIHDLGSMRIGALLDLPTARGPGSDRRAATPDPAAPPDPHAQPSRAAAPRARAGRRCGGVRRRRVCSATSVCGSYPATSQNGSVDALGGTRHTSARRYSHDDPGRDRHRGQRRRTGVGLPQRRRARQLATPTERSRHGSARRFPPEEAMGEHDADQRPHAEHGEVADRPACGGGVEAGAERVGQRLDRAAR